MRNFHKLKFCKTNESYDFPKASLKFIIMGIVNHCLVNLITLLIKFENQYKILFDSNSESEEFDDDDLSQEIEGMSKYALNQMQVADETDVDSEKKRKNLVFIIILFQDILSFNRMLIKTTIN